MPEPCSRTPAQIEASRRNGARSVGPVTPEGKTRASRNALKHGLCAMHHLVLEGEVPDDLEALIGRLTDEVGAASEIEARLARRLAIAFWKGERAERIEVALFDAAPRTLKNGSRSEEADPLTTFDVRRFNAIRGQQAQIGREIRNCLQELRRLRKDALAVDTAEPGQGDPRQQNCTNDLWRGTHEPETRLQNEPGSPPPANDDAAVTADTASRNEPEHGPVAPAVMALRAAITAELAARREDPGRDQAILDRLMREYWVTRTGLPLAATG